MAQNEIRLLGYTPQQMADDPALGASVRRAMAARQDGRLRFMQANFSRLACKAMGRTFGLTDTAEGVYEEFFDKMDSRGRIKGLADPAAGREAVAIWRELENAGFFPHASPPGGHAA